MRLALYVIFMRRLCRATPDIVVQDRLDPKIASVIVESPQAPSSLHVAVGFYVSLGFQARFILARFAMVFQTYASKWGGGERDKSHLTGVPMLRC